MRYHDLEELAELNAQPWQADLLKLNPAYCSWGPHEDYMWREGSGWNSRQLFATWAEFGPWGLDELNECVNFYFSVRRPNEECRTCGGSGYHPDAKPIADSFYQHSSPTGYGWNDKITQDELDALIEAGRIEPGTPLAKVNEANGPLARGIRQHDGINRVLLIGARCKRLGVPTQCPTCSGSGRVFTAPEAKVSLTLWWLHPRKGCSRGLEIENIEQTDLPAVFSFLREAAQRNADRFAKIPELSSETPKETP